MGAMVFWAATPGAAREFAESGSRTLTDAVFAATPELRAEFGYRPEDDEDADFAAQLFASLHCLVAGGDRLVLAVELDRQPTSASIGADLGRVAEVTLPWRRVRAVFRDAPGALPALRAYADTLRGAELEALWEDQVVRELLTTHDLLWFDGSELEQALAGLRDPEAASAEPGKDG